MVSLATVCRIPQVDVIDVLFFPCNVQAGCQALRRIAVWLVKESFRHDGDLGICCILGGLFISNMVFSPGIELIGNTIAACKYFRSILNVFFVKSK